MDLEEEKFENELVRELKVFRWSCYHVGTSIPGIHDRLCFRLNKGFTLELKVIKESQINNAVRDLFKPSQFPFYIDQIRDSGTPTIIGIKVLVRKPFYIYICLRTEQEIIQFFKMKRNELLSNPLDNVQDLAIILDTKHGWN